MCGSPVQGSSVSCGEPLPSTPGGAGSTWNCGASRPIRPGEPPSGPPGRDDQCCLLVVEGDEHHLLEVDPEQLEVHLLHRDAGVIRECGTLGVTGDLRRAAGELGVGTEGVGLGAAAV